MEHEGKKDPHTITLPKGDKTASKMHVLLLCVFLFVGGAECITDHS